MILKKMKKINVADIKNAKYLKFYIEDGFLCCMDIITKEEVVIDELKKILKFTLSLIEKEVMKNGKI